MLALLVGILILLVVFIHAGYVMGWKAGFNFAIIGWLVAFVLEDLGVRTGIIFGQYYFTSILGPKLDVIPLVIPCLWVIASYIAWSITNLLLEQSPLQSNFSTSRLIFGTVLGAVIMSSMDVNADPISVSNHFWIWIHHGSYFGVPIHNYVGWFIVSFITLLLHSLLTKKDLQATSDNDLTKSQTLWTIFPLVMYLGSGIGVMSYNFEHVLGLVSFYLFGIPLLTCTWQWCKWYRKI